MGSSAYFRVVTCEYIRCGITLLIGPLSPNDRELLNRTLAIQPVTTHKESGIPKRMTSRNRHGILCRLIKPQPCRTGDKGFCYLRVIVGVAQNKLGVRGGCIEYLSFIPRTVF